MQTRAFGFNSRGEKATLYRLENHQGMVMEVTDFGATLYSLLVPTQNGPLDVVLGYDDPAGYEGPGGTFFGATVGRNANRIAGGRFTLGGRTYTLDVNNGPNNLHSGLDFYASGRFPPSRKTPSPLPSTVPTGIRVTPARWIFPSPTR